MPSPHAPSLDETPEYGRSDVVIRPICKEDQAAILEIYQQGIESGNATFTAQAPDWAGWDRGHLEPCRLVATIAGDVVGWAALSAYSSRDVYRGVAELSIYIANQAKGRHVGTLLLGHLVDLSEKEGFWTLQAGIFADNVASIKLHEKFGFRLVGIRERIAQMSHGPNKGRWRDVSLYERRSLITGQ
ncbi:GNAT family N-acetyltransferase [uncultured Cohaesibacter sp.]|uniref:GNAT family N-acetyltransferase n=1 Tax=uncultured Cohaesibacter sp. TaxID=1002546 RepID=UPI0029C7A210|nr:GNAT family N-acetyltransferase [uncultured Cohaesibacter sp.]